LGIFWDVANSENVQKRGLGLIAFRSATAWLPLLSKKTVINALRERWMEWSLCTGLVHARRECNWNEVPSVCPDYTLQEAYIIHPPFHVTFLLRWLHSNQIMTIVPFRIMHLNEQRQDRTGVMPLTCALCSHRYQEHIFRYDWRSSDPWQESRGANTDILSSAAKVPYNSRFSSVSSLRLLIEWPILSVGSAKPTVSITRSFHLRRIFWRNSDVYHFF
jgi:hypothetical protein